MRIEDIFGEVYKQVVENQKTESYDNWKFHDEETIESDFSEYKNKEKRKWETRANSMGFRFPIFNTIEDYKESLNSASIITLDDNTWDSVEHMSYNDSIENIKLMVSSYTVPRDVDRIVDGIENNNPIPYPVILKGNNGLFIMSGNTRSNVARVLGSTPKALLLDVSE